MLLVADFAAVLGSYLAAFIARSLSGGNLPFQLYVESLPWLMVFPFLYFLFTLYPATFLRRQEELKRLFIATSVGFLCLVFFTFAIKEGHNFSRMTLILGWGGSLFAVPLARHAVRKYCSHFSWWAKPCIMFGDGDRVTELCRELRRARRYGVRPAALILDVGVPCPVLSSALGPEDAVLVERIPLGNPERAREALEAIAHRYAHPYAVVSFGSDALHERQTWLNLIDRCFQRMIIIPDATFGGRAWIASVSIGRLSGLIMCQNLLDPRRMLLKRGMDLLLTVLGGLLAFPLMLALGIAIRLDSPGPALFTHQRIGRNGKHFKVIKFRTMAVDGDAILERHLDKNPEARAEWDATQKLRDDPRITRVGRFLRKTSLDELPQLCNVICGEMSLVGPRPIVDDEIDKYGAAYELYTRVRPGLTGLWQVSGRNNTSYEDRVWLDRHYVCNWSVWFDVLILARTVPEVLRCSGAY